MGDIVENSIVDSKAIVGVSSRIAELCTSKVVVALLVDVSDDISPICVGVMLGGETVGSKEAEDEISGNTELCVNKLVLADVAVVSDVSEDRLPDCIVVGDNNVGSVGVGSGKTELVTGKVVLSAVVAFGDVSEENSPTCVDNSMVSGGIVDSKEMVDVI